MSKEEEIIECLIKYLERTFKGKIDYNKEARRLYGFIKDLEKKNERQTQP